MSSSPRSNRRWYGYATSFGEVRKYIPTGTGAKECFIHIARKHEAD
jgi:hypothetical protein